MSNEQSKTTTETGGWWVKFQHDRQGFFDTVADRADELARKYGSSPVSTVPSKLEQTFMDRQVKKARAL